MPNHVKLTNPLWVAKNAIVICLADSLRYRAQHSEAATLKSFRSCGLPRCKEVGQCAANIAEDSHLFLDVEGVDTVEPLRESVVPISNCIEQVRPGRKSLPSDSDFPIRLFADCFGLKALVAPNGGAFAFRQHHFSSRLGGC